jgi:predicted dehydrogenase
VTIAETIERRIASFGELRRIEDRFITIAVQGCGSWTQDTILPELRALHADLNKQGRPGLDIFYVGLGTKFLDENNKEVELDPDTERYRCVFDEAAQRDLDTTKFDIVFIATPDFDHIDSVLEWRRRSETAKLVLVEKPFADSSYDILRLRNSLSNSGHPIDGQLIRGFDHYVVYASDLFLAADQLDPLLREPSRLSFSMTETRPIEADRLRSLQSGLIFDMASHFLALATTWCDLDLPMDIAVHWRGRHSFADEPSLEGREFFAETAAKISFQSRVLGDNGVSSCECECRIGKATDADTKYLTITSSDGSATARIELTRQLSGIEIVASGSDSHIEPQPTQRDATRHGRIVRAYADADSRSLCVLLDIDECYILVKLLEKLRWLSVGLPLYERGDPQW